jgi:tetratricopeptide (TPR) repeat protein
VLAIFVASGLLSGLIAQHSDHLHSPRLGQVTFETSCLASADGLVERGLGWLHSFEYEEAERSFVEAASVDPGCAIANWGVAMSNYHPLWAPPTQSELEKGIVALEKARAAGPRTRRERDYIDALATFFADADKADHKARALAYSSVMEGLHNRYPGDREAAVFYALSLVAAGTMDDDPTYERETRAAAILNRVQEQQPDHPGVAHYLIHSFDYPSLAHLAVPAARSYASIAPASAHAQHMPSHIFTRLGLWKEAIRSNTTAEAAARAYASSRGMPGSWDERLHAMDYLVYGYLQTGQDGEAARVVEELNRITRVDPPNFKVAYAVTAIPARYLLERRQWEEAAALDLPANAQALVQWDKFPWAEANIHFAKAVGAARSGNLDIARQQLNALEKVEQSLSVAAGNYDWRKQLGIQRQIAAGWLAHAEGNSEQAVTRMRAAADLDDATEKHPVTPGSILPAREQFGELLLELRRPKDALTEFENALRNAPNRYRSLHGAALSASLADDRPKARRYYARLVEVAEKSTGGRPELEEARSLLSAEE